MIYLGSFRSNKGKTAEIWIRILSSKLIYEQIMIKLSMNINSVKTKNFVVMPYNHYIILFCNTNGLFQIQRIKFLASNIRGITGQFNPKQIKISNVLLF